MTRRPYVTLRPTGVGNATGVDERKRADRPVTLDGAIVGLLANGKVNSAELLECVLEELNEHFNIAGALRHRKGSVSVPPTEEAFTELTTRSTVVLTATGD